jgi:hypothetical protein
MEGVNSLVPGGNCDIWRANSSEPVHERVALLPHVLAPCRGICSLASAQACAQLGTRHFVFLNSSTSAEIIVLREKFTSC